VSAPLEQNRPTREIIWSSRLLVPEGLLLDQARLSDEAWPAALIIV